MKKLFRTMMLTASAMLIFTACKEDPETPKPIPAKFVLTMSGGQAITMEGTDVTKAVTVTANAAVAEDVVVNLELIAQEGDAELSASSVTILKGSTEASADITFFANAFPEETAERIVTVKGSTSAENVLFPSGSSSTDFGVRGEGGKQQTRTLTVTTKATRINTVYAAGSAQFTFTLNLELDEDVAIAYDYGSALSVDEEDIEWNPENIVIAAGEKTVVVTMAVPKETEGDVPVIFSSDSDVEFDGASVTIEFYAETIPDSPVALCTLTNEWGIFTYLPSVTIGVNLFDFRADYRDVLDGNTGWYFDRTGMTAVPVSNGDIIGISYENFDSGATDPYIIGAWVDWNRDGRLAEDENTYYTKVVAGETESVKVADTGAISAPDGAPDGVYYMRIMMAYDGDGTSLNGGCGDIDSGFVVDIAIDYSADGEAQAMIFSGEEKEFFVMADLDKTVVVALSQALTEPVVVNLGVSATGTAPTLSASSVTFAAGEITKTVMVTFRESDYTTPDLVNTVTITASSPDIGVIGSNVQFTAKSEPAEGLQPQPLCTIAYIYTNYVYMNFTVGSYTLTPAHTSAGTYSTLSDMTGSISATVSAGSTVSITPSNKNTGEGDKYIVGVWVDWNKDGSLTEDEAIINYTWIATAAGTSGTTQSVTLSPPAGARPGEYYMRLGIGYDWGKSGCVKPESGDVVDIAVTLQ